MCDATTSTPSGPGATGPAPLAAADVARLKARVRSLAPGLRADLDALVRIPSVSAPAFDPASVEDSARAVAGLLTASGFDDVRILRADGTPAAGAPAVIARRPAPDGAATVLLYAHHDVQPPGDPAGWDTPAFEPTERDGRLFGRGAADDKAGVVVHLAALRTLAEELAVGVTVFVEGEEEVGSPTFAAFLHEHRDLLAADVIVVADSGNWNVGTPALTSSLRGLLGCVVEVSTLDHAVHSGMFGGAVPDAMTATIRLLDTLWDDTGRLAVEGLVRGEAADLGYTAEQFRADAGLLDGVEPIGTGRLESRLWTEPSLTVLGMDVPSVEEPANALLPQVRAKLSMRLAPGQDPEEAFTALRDHLVARAPWGAHVRVLPGECGRPWAGDLGGEVYDVARWALAEAWGTAPVSMGLGGSIPFIPLLEEAFPEATVLVTGVEDPDARAHGTNESVHLEELWRACTAETLLLAALGAR
ncbi:MAG: cysteinylglycine-S-conjugate dipeptidase [Actinomycetota bacterium]|nr:cysteinylglycine-S-conjugate dipeptidase [Actinomycetota bacterium]